MKCRHTPRKGGCDAVGGIHTTAGRGLLPLLLLLFILVSALPAVVGSSHSIPAARLTPTEAVSLMRSPSANTTSNSNKNTNNKSARSSGRNSTAVERRAVIDGSGGAASRTMSDDAGEADSSHAWELREPVEVLPDYNADLNANVTSLVLHVRLRELRVPLRLDAAEFRDEEEEVELGKGGHMKDRNQSETGASEKSGALRMRGGKSPRADFVYRGRVYDIANDTATEKKNPSLRDVVPGPTLRVVPGGFIHLKVINDLQEEGEGSSTHANATTPRWTAQDLNSNGETRKESADGGGDRRGSRRLADKEGKASSSVPFNDMFFTMHAPNITNVHFHGVHGDPKIDDPFVSIPPGGEHEYLLPIPQNHAPGLHWYHAHSHGSVYFQVMGGLFGALIVEEKKESSTPPSSQQQQDRYAVSRPWLAPGVPSHVLVFHLYRIGPDAGAEGCDGQTMGDTDRLIGNTVAPSSPSLVWSDVRSEEVMDKEKTDGSAERPSTLSTPSATVTGNNSTATTTPKRHRDSEAGSGYRLPSNLFLVNGQHRPTLFVTPDTPTTLRMLYAAGSCSLNLTLPTTTGSHGAVPVCRFLPAAVDGVPLDIVTSPTVNTATHHSSRRPSETVPSPTVTVPTTATLSAARNWLYFIPATRQEIIISCAKPPKGKDVEGGDGDEREGTEDEGLAVRNGGPDGEVIFYIAVKASSSSASLDTPKSNSSAASASAMQPMSSLTDSVKRVWQRHPAKGNTPHSMQSVETQLRELLTPLAVRLPAAPPPARKSHAHHYDASSASGSSNTSSENQDSTPITSVAPPAYLDTRVRPLPPRRSPTSSDDVVNAERGGGGGGRGAHKNFYNRSFTFPSPYFHWDLSMSQEAVLQSPALSDTAPHQRPFYVMGEGRECRSGGGGETCYYHPFEGPRGDTPSAYHGFVVPLGRVVEAHVFGDATDGMPHPLHFHVNHFQFISFTPRPNGHHTELTSDLAAYGLWPGQWRDTIPIFDGETVLRWRAATFPGEILYHCHMLSHEDRGMMSSYYVQSDGGEKDGDERGDGGGTPQQNNTHQSASRRRKNGKTAGGNRKGDTEGRTRRRWWGRLERHIPRISSPVMRTVLFVLSVLGLVIVTPLLVYWCCCTRSGRWGGGTIDVEEEERLPLHRPSSPTSQGYGSLNAV